jgi:hypothetical protein
LRKRSRALISRTTLSAISALAPLQLQLLEPGLRVQQREHGSTS